MYLLGGGGGTWPWGGVPGPGGCTWSRGGVPSPGGVYLVPGGCTWSRGGVPGPGGVYLVPGGCTWSRGGVPGPGGGGCTWPQGGGVPGPGGVYLVRGVYLVPGGVPGPGGGVPGPGGVYLVPGGCTWSRGGCTWSRGVYLVPGGVYLVPGGGVPGPRGGCTWSRGGVPGPGGGVPGPGGGTWSRGGCTWSRGGYLVRYSPPPVNRMKNRCKNITLAKTSFRPVKIVPCEWTLNSGFSRNLRWFHGLMDETLFLLWMIYLSIVRKICQLVQVLLSETNPKHLCCIPVVQHSKAVVVNVNEKYYCDNWRQNPCAVHSSPTLRAIRIYK